MSMNFCFYWMRKEKILDREKFISQLPITEKNIDKQWIMNRSEERRVGKECL